MCYSDQADVSSGVSAGCDARLLIANGNSLRAVAKRLKISIGMQGAYDFMKNEYSDTSLKDQIMEE